MAKAVYRPPELEVLKNKIVLKPPEAFELAHFVEEEQAAEEVVEEKEVYTGPTAEDLRREAEAFKEHWAKEREAMIHSAKIEAERLIREAAEKADNHIQIKNIEGMNIINHAKDEAEKIVSKSEEKIKKMEYDSTAIIKTTQKEAEEKGFEEGRETGYEEGGAEVNRLVDRTRVILERAQDKRSEILIDTEQEIIDLVLLMTRKVVKVISENQRNVVISNVSQALKKIKTRGNIFIRVNLADLKLTTEHTKDFIKLVEGAKSVQVLEDSTVDSGGCIIETDFGEIDARIASQLAELEAKILEITPLSSRAKAVQTQPGI